MRNQLEAQGFMVGEGAEAAADADFILLNTCAFIEAAIEESLDTILELAELKRVKSGEAKLVVVGCLSSRFGADLEVELPEVAAFVPLVDEAKVGALLKSLGADKRTGRFASPDHKGTVPILAWAYVKISDGCSRHCSYCTIPAIRGPYRDNTFAAINAEIKGLIAGGAREIILIGQDTGLWSEPSDRGNEESSADEQDAPQSIAGLLDTLARTYPDTWFRLMYLQPEGITDELLDIMAKHANIARYLDIPLQHANAEILASMNRKGSGEEYLKLVRHIKDKLPGVVMRTTVIVGYPGEREQDFEELADFLAAARFDYVGIFVYSREEGTAAAELTSVVDEKTALDRLQELRNLTDTIGFELAAEQEGSVVDVLVCGQDEEGIFGRTQGQAPDVDGLTYLATSGTEKPARLSTHLEPGTVVCARIIESVLYDLFAEPTTETQ
jgi:ribosomal protein S12 methylthiotransferase